MLTEAVVRMVLPGAQPLGVVAVWLGVRVTVGVLDGTVAEAVGVNVGVFVSDGVDEVDGVEVGVRVPVAVRVAVEVRVGVAVPITAKY
jgi:hypothetical protein